MLAGDEWDAAQQKSIPLPTGSTWKLSTTKQERTETVDKASLLGRQGASLFAVAGLLENQSPPGGARQFGFNNKLDTVPRPPRTAGRRA